jgi:hypothetical protein
VIKLEVVPLTSVLFIFVINVSLLTVGSCNGPHAPRVDSPTKQWQNKVSSNFERLFCFAEKEVDKRRRSTDSMSPRNGHVSTTTGNSSHYMKNSLEYQERPKTPCGNTECTTSPDSGIGRDLPLVSDPWGHSVENAESSLSLTISKKDDPRHNGSEKNLLPNGRRSLTPMAMEVPRTPSPSRHDDQFDDDLMDELPPTPRVPTPCNRQNHNGVKTEVDGDFEERHTSTISIRTDLNGEIKIKSEKNEFSSAEISSFKEGDKIESASVPSSICNSISSSGDQQHPKKRWNNWGGTQQPARLHSPHAGSTDGRSSVASDCSSHAESLAQSSISNIPANGTTACGGPGSGQMPVSTGASQPTGTPNSNVSLNMTPKFRPKGKSFDWNNERSSPFSNSSPSPNPVPIVPTPPHPQNKPSSNPVQQQSQNHHQFMSGTSNTTTSQLQVTHTSIAGSSPQTNNNNVSSHHAASAATFSNHQNSHPHPPQPMQQHQKTCSIPLPIGSRIPPPPPPPHDGKSILSAVDQVIMQTLTSGNRPNNSSTSNSYDHKDYQQGPTAYNNNLYKQSSASYNTNSQSGQQHNQYNAQNGNSNALSPSKNPYPQHHHQANPIQQQQQHPSYSSHHTNYGSQQHPTNPNHSMFGSGTGQNPAASAAAAGARHHAHQQQNNSSYPVMQNPKIHPSAYTSQGPHGGHVGGSAPVSNSAPTSTYYNANGGSHSNTNTQHHLSTKQVPYEPRNGYSSHHHHRQQAQSYPTYNMGGGGKANAGPGSGGHHDIYSQGQPQHQGYTHYNHTSRGQTGHHAYNNSTSNNSNPHQSHGLPPPQPHPGQNQGYHHNHPHNQMLPARR